MPQEITCKICLNAQREEPDEYVVYEDAFWRVRHSRETNIAGYLVIESRRHYLDFSEANDDECQTYGFVLKGVTEAIRQVTDCSRVYSFSLAEMVPHFHLHLIPRTNYLPPAYRGRGIMSYPIVPAADENVVALICQRVRRTLRTTATAGKCP